MARERDGWEYVDGGARWAPTVEGQIANMIYDKYGQEYDEARRQLDDLVRAAERGAAERLSEAGYEEAARLIFPTYPKENE
ncbi:hypothetical protein D854_gp22 [Streptomyces phage R4]|uniref:Uncharacterized protein n=1 Tax=Streptomyces phage R4 TaxID=10732 RepID=K4I2R9_9CAUD|nr:hypothetical protein D854_gp22 [Streptomyces phage R4]AFU62120.1 hypothetical protein R4_66 [Streptomyces phage R4]